MLFLNIFYPKKARSIFQGCRGLLTVAKYPVLTESGKIGAFLLQSDYDKKSNESDNDYHKRSFAELTTLIPPEFHNKPTLLLRLNQCVIDHRVWSKREISIANIGHLWAGIFQISNNELHCYRNLLVSKIDSGFETAAKTMQSGFFSTKYKSERQHKTGAREYYLFLDLEITRLNLDQLEETSEENLLDNRPYDLQYSACGQAVYEWLTRKSAAPRISPQTAATQAIFEIIADDDTFHSNLRDTLITSGFSTTAYEIHKKTLRSNQNPSKNRNTQETTPGDSDGNYSLR